MNTARLLLTLALAAIGILAARPAQADIQIRLSVKFIVSTNGTMPCCGNGTFNSFEDITNQVDFANQQLRTLGRGYQFQIWELTTVGGPASAFYRSPREDKPLLEQAAEADKTGFKYRDNAINLYINNADGSAICSFPPDDDIILFGQSSRTTSLWHECGHYFNLQHTHSGQQNLNSNGSDCDLDCDCAIFMGGTADQCPDTLADHTCWGTQNAVALGNYGLSYSSLNATQQRLVDNVLNNIMSYHDNRDRLTPDQLDRWTDAANGPRIADVTGRTRFVDRLNSGAQAGSSALPFRTVAAGIFAVNDPDDIVLVRPGNYNEPMSITKPLTLRATRGNATIGRP